MSERIKEIQARAEAATEGPWAVGGSPWAHSIERGYSFIVSPGYEGDGGIEELADAEFIAHAREDVPWLLAEVARLRETNTKLNRRATKAEAFVGKSIEELQGKGLSLGRALANAGAEIANQRAEAADALLADGFRKPAVVTAAEELDALPVGSVVLDKHEGAWIKARNGSATWWFTGDGLDFESKSSLGVASLFGPATVLHVGDN